MVEQRRGQRISRSVPISLRSKPGYEQVGMTENVSPNGILFGTPHHFTVGQEVEIGGAGDHPPLKATIVRFERNPDAETLLWRFKAAAQFVLRTPAWLLEQSPG
jgi:hypothetical protein